jgi:hypothetical protein
MRDYVQENLIIDWTDIYNHFLSHNMYNCHFIHNIHNLDLTQLE